MTVLALFRRSWTWILIVLLAQLTLHLTFLSPSTHSGQIAIPWMLNEGRALFDTVVEQHAPGGSLLVALAQRVLPFPPLLTVRLLDVLLVILTGLLVYHVASKLAGQAAAWTALLFWVWWEPVYNNILFYYDAIVGAMILLAVSLWLALARRQPWWLAPLGTGLILGGATLFKQHAWLGVILFGLWLLLQREERARLATYLPGALLPPGILVLCMATQGHLQSYMYWNWVFNLSGLMPGEPYSGDFLRKLLLSGLLAGGYLPLALRQAKPSRCNWLLVALMGVAGAGTLIPRGGEYHVMGLLPMLAVMSGVTLTAVWQALGEHWWIAPHHLLEHTPTGTLVLTGLLAVAFAGWGLTGIAPYFGSPSGPGGTPAYDEFNPIAEALRAVRAPGDTLFILPETDSTPQIHALAEMLPPGFWVKGWAWYLAAPGVVERLLSEWATTPPDYIVYFPNLVTVGEPDIRPLVTFMHAHYTPILEIPDILYHGPVVIYRRR